VAEFRFFKQRSEQSGDNLKHDTKHDGDSQDAVESEEKISRLQVSIVAVLFLIMFITAGFVIKSIYFKPSVVRTSAEREILQYQGAIDNNPNNAGPHISLAGVYMDNGEPEKAITELNRALALDPQSWKADFMMGLAYEALEKYDDAIDFYLKASKLNPKNEYAYYQLGKLYQKRGLHKVAINYLRKALSVDPNLADVHYNLGVCYEKTGRKDLAKIEYTETLKYVNDFKEAKDALKRLE
jgi:tetratricopeptide (TPR) repeat protein